MSEIILPSEVSGSVGRFDRFAEWASGAASRATFFTACVGIVAAWLAEGMVDAVFLGHGFTYFLDDKFQLQINTLTTILTFLMVALLQNTQTRQNNATQHKLNAVAAGLARLLEDQSADGVEEAKELTDAVGLEYRESA